MIDALPGFVWTALPDGYVDFWNQITCSDELYRIFELDRSAPITTERIRRRVHPEDVTQLDKTVEKARATDCLFKPFSDLDLLKALELALG